MPAVSCIGRDTELSVPIQVFLSVEILTYLSLVFLAADSALKLLASALSTLNFSLKYLRLKALSLLKCIIFGSLFTFSAHE